MVTRDHNKNRSRFTTLRFHASDAIRSIFQLSLQCLLVVFNAQIREPEKWVERCSFYNRFFFAL